MKERLSGNLSSPMLCMCSQLYKQSLERQWSTDCTSLQFAGRRDREAPQGTAHGRTNAVTWTF